MKMKTTKEIECVGGFEDYLLNEYDLADDVKVVSRRDGNNCEFVILLYPENLENEILNLFAVGHDEGCFDVNDILYLD